MNQISKRAISLMLTLLMVLSLLVGGLPTEVAAAGTGYTTSGDVKYDESGAYTANWGARNEVCGFLSPYANGFYTTQYSFETLSQLKGGNSQSTAPQSELFEALQALMESNHKTLSSYGDTRTLLQYTDCQLNDTSTILSFYSGEAFNSTWDSGKTWNREHVWPSSKCLHPGHNNNTKDESTDIMMIRPTLKTENGSRGNKAYGISSGYYTPNTDVRGDCARVFLYMYVRWGITDGNGEYSTWGTKGVMENLDILLQWMEADPVDTWEMGRNDAVQSITGTRNVFVDYPEYAWLLFGKSVPTGVTTPSRNGQGGVAANPGDYKDNNDSSNGSTDNSGSNNGGSNVTDDVTIATAPLAGVAYKLRMDHTKNGKIYYFNGGIYESSKGSYAWYLGSTTDYDKAADVYAEAVSGGYKLYFLKNGQKVYINMYQGEGRTDASLSIDGSHADTVYTWDSTHKTFLGTVAGKQYFIGTDSAKNYTSFSASFSANLDSYILAQLCTKGASTGADTTPDPTVKPTETVPPATEAPTAPPETEAPTEVTEPTEATDPTESIVPTETVTPTETAPASTGAAESTSPVVLILCVIVAIAAISGACCFFIFKKKKNG